MRKLYIVFIFATISVLLLYTGLKIGWLLREKQVLNIYILDKTVTRNDRHEHKSFTWLLNNNRIVLPNNKNYSYTKDYYGFSPVDVKNESFDFRSIRINEVDAYAAAFDVAYYTDCYGVHSFEWYKGKTKPIRSQKVYGGLNQNDYLLLKKMLNNGKLIIGEYNMFSTPTNALVRSKTEELMDMGWTGWSGRYFTTLNINHPAGPPNWMKNLYESHHMGVWPNDKAGIVLINNDGVMELLIEGEHLNSSLPVIKTSEQALNRFGVNQNIPFEQWFEVIHPGNNSVHSYFELDVTQLGKDRLQRNGLPHSFPAVIEGNNNGQYFYFCGDFAENPAKMWTAKLAGGSKINHLLFRHNAPNRANFFRYYYTPLMENILREYYNHLERKKN